MKSWDFLLERDWPLTILPLRQCLAVRTNDRGCTFCATAMHYSRFQQIVDVVAQIVWSTTRSCIFATSLFSAIEVAHAHTRAAGCDRLFHRTSMSCIVYFAHAHADAARHSLSGDKYESNLRTYLVRGELKGYPNIYPFSFSSNQTSPQCVRWSA